MKYETKLIIVLANDKTVLIMFVILYNLYINKTFAFNR